MLRCELEPAGKYEVKVAYFDSANQEDTSERNLDLGPHSDVFGQGGRLLEAAPRASQGKPYVGDLCPCELRFVSGLPGKAFSAHRRYEFKELK